MIIESCVTDYSAYYQNSSPLLVGQYPSIDTLVFEQSDLTQRPVINWYTTDPIYYVLYLPFQDYTVEIRSPYKPLIRHVLQCVLLDIDVLEADTRRYFPEYFL